ncbi:hypothetical protein [uncultured Flavobacterium sp.]|uniref:hypothetical protein n=1 Tax=uncultured Flavobacterium sp. TaxID=165435 RepID=UPI002630620D|nr:hypothetical protein [uncultured Flavobacterium sp.]
MKNKFKSFSISLMIVFLLVTISCQVEETIVETENIKNQNDLLIKKISFNEIKNSAVVDKINNTKKLSKKTITTSSKIIKDTLNNFYINSDEGMYIEKTDGTKSYTFSVFRENATDLENLVIIVYPNNQIKTFLVDYNKTFNELNSMSLEQMQNNQIEYYEINFNTNEFIPVFQNNSNGRYICETIMFWDTIPCYEGDLVGAGQGIDCWGWVIIGHTCWEGGSGGGEGFGFDSDFGTNGNGSPTGGGGSTGSGSSGSSSNQIITTPTTSLESEQEAQALIKRQKNFTANLSWNQNAWLNNNQEAENNIYEYLESQVTDTLATEYSTESVQFVNELIDLAIENNLELSPINSSNNIEFDNLTEFESFMNLEEISNVISSSLSFQVDKKITTRNVNITPLHQLTLEIIITPSPNFSLDESNSTSYLASNLLPGNSWIQTSIIVTNSNINNGVDAEITISGYMYYGVKIGDYEVGTKRRKQIIIRFEKSTGKIYYSEVNNLN